MDIIPNCQVNSCPATYSRINLDRFQHQDHSYDSLNVPTLGMSRIEMCFEIPYYTTIIRAVPATDHPTAAPATAAPPSAAPPSAAPPSAAPPTAAPPSAAPPSAAPPSAAPPSAAPPSSASCTDYVSDTAATIQASDTLIPCDCASQASDTLIPCDCAATIQASDTLIPCDCAVNCTELCGHSIDLSSQEPVYLCNSSCPCPPSCHNRLPEPDASLRVAWDTSKHWSLYASQDLGKGVYIGDYTGEIIHSDSVQERYKGVIENYVLTVKEWSAGQCLVTHTDALNQGNHFRFMNHSCDPNVEILPVRDDFIYPRISCWTVRPIVAGEELCFDYGKTLGTTKCLCAAKNCRGYLPMDPWPY